MSDVFFNYKNCVRSWYALMVWVYVLSLCTEFMFNLWTQTKITCLIRLKKGKRKELTIQTYQLRLKKGAPFRIIFYVASSIELLHKTE